MYSEYKDNLIIDKHKPLIGFVIICRKKKNRVKKLIKRKMSRHLVMMTGTVQNKTKITNKTTFFFSICSNKMQQKSRKSV